MSNTGHYLGAGAVLPYYWVDRPGTYHNQGLVLSFADGHADWHKWVQATTLGPIGLFGPTHTSPRDRDVKWLQAHCAEPK